MIVHAPMITICVNIALKMTWGLSATIIDLIVCHTDNILTVNYVLIIDED